MHELRDGQRRKSRRLVKQKRLTFQQLPRELMRFSSSLIRDEACIFSSTKLIKPLDRLIAPISFVPPMQCSNNRRRRRRRRRRELRNLRAKNLCWQLADRQTDRSRPGLLPQ